MPARNRENLDHSAPQAVNVGPELPPVPPSPGPTTWKTWLLEHYAACIVTFAEDCTWRNVMCWSLVALLLGGVTATFGFFWLVLGLLLYAAGYSHGAAWGDCAIEPQPGVPERRSTSPLPAARHSSWYSSSVACDPSHRRARILRRAIRQPEMGVHVAIVAILLMICAYCSMWRRFEIAHSHYTYDHLKGRTEALESNLKLIDALKVVRRDIRALKRQQSGDGGVGLWTWAGLWDWVVL